MESFKGKLCDKNHFYAKVWNMVKRNNPAHFMQKIQFPYRVLLINVMNSINGDTSSMMDTYFTKVEYV